MLLNTITDSQVADQRPKYEPFTQGETREDLKHAEINLSNFASEGEELVKAALKATNDVKKWDKLWCWMKGCQELMEMRNEKLRASDQFTEAAVKLLVVTPPIIEVRNFLC